MLKYISSQTKNLHRLGQAVTSASAPLDLAISPLALLSSNKADHRSYWRRNKIHFKTELAMQDLP